jgi:hypothetical protein
MIKVRFVSVYRHIHIGDPDEVDYCRHRKKLAVDHIKKCKISTIITNNQNRLITLNISENSSGLKRVKPD